MQPGLCHGSYLRMHPKPIACIPKNLFKACVALAPACPPQAKPDRSGPPKAEDCVRAYDSLLGHVRELAENAARLGGAAGEVLLEECAAKARLPAALLFPVAVGAPAIIAFRRLPEGRLFAKARLPCGYPLFDYTHLTMIDNCYHG
jgi:hypothetical protein